MEITENDFLASFCTYCGTYTDEVREFGKRLLDSGVNDPRWAYVLYLRNLGVEHWKDSARSLGFQV